MSSIPNDVLSAFSNLDYAENISPNEALGDRYGEWPPDGDHIAFLDEIKVEGGKVFNYKEGNVKKAITGCVEVDIFLTLESDPDRPEPLQWHNDKIMLIPPAEYVNLPAYKGCDQKQRVNIQLARLKGSLKAVLGRDVGSNILGAIDEVNRMAKDANKQFVVRVNTRSEKKTKYTDRTLQVLEVVSR